MNKIITLEWRCTCGEKQTSICNHTKLYNKIKKLEEENKKLKKENSIYKQGAESGKI